MPNSHAHIALETANLSIGYGEGKNRLEILSNISLKAYKGQLICFMGPNGVGKSTLLRTLCTLQPTLAGTISVGGINIHEISPNEKAKKIGLVLTDPINAGNMSAYDVVALGRYPYMGWQLRSRQEDDRAIEQAILQTQTHDFINKKIYELSDGQLQKIMIARALAQDTPILILDEPTAHLDLNNRVSIVNLLKTLAHKHDKTIIMATHEIDLALQTADRLWLAGFNQPIVEGMPEDLVLNGKIDEVFQFKGYDLKTGTLKKQSLGYKVSLEGSGYLYLWTKNALERNGFEIDTEADTHVTIIKENETCCWQTNEGTTFGTLEGLINQLIKQH
ncbi:MAG: ABC transporter ATP-binding protein [Fulvivirga sp.]|nr:ABC transporter ATP-binding protein [Fulvivirga sp.]